MTTTSPRSGVGREAVEQASAWFVEFRVGDADTAVREEFALWLRRSPDNVQAYLEIARTYAELPAISDGKAIDAEALITYARSEGNVIPLRAGGSVARPAAARSVAPRMRQGMRLALAASLLLVAAGGLVWLHGQRDTYSTGIGEQRSITLADGSTIDMNARTRLRVRFTEQERGVELLAGQALFQVAKDQWRPFIVRSDGAQVRAVGTQFDVYRRESGTTVTVLEGRVAVLPAGLRADAAPSMDLRSQPGASTATSTDAAAGALLLAAGDQVTVGRDRRVAVPTRTDVTAVTAWTQRRVVFDASPLTEVAQEFNRYTTRPLIVEDADLADFLISGVYSSTDPASLVLFLREQPGLQVIETSTEIRISRK